LLICFIIIPVTRRVNKFVEKYVTVRRKRLRLYKVYVLDQDQ